MAPDISTLPSSPRLDRAPQRPSTTSNTASRRTSQIMGPPQQPASATFNPRSPVMSPNESVSVPMRHPRPLTAAELYLECEKEQEAVVNRLTRELTALRAQSASVASNASSASAVSASLLPVDIGDLNPTHQMTGATHPTPSRRHRSSSSISGRSIPTPSTTASGMTNVSTQAQPGGTAPLGSVSQAHADRTAAATGDRSTLSRNPSMSASGNSTPARHSLDVSRTHFALPHRPSLSREPSQSSHMSMQAHSGTPAPTAFSPTQSPPLGNVNPAVQSHTDTTAYRTEMEIVKAENEALRQRVRALERALRSRRRDSSQSEALRLETSTSSGRDMRYETPAERVERPSREFNRVPSYTSPSASAGLGVWDGGVGGVAGPRERSESQSTTASSRRAIGVTDDEVRVGESASSVGRAA